MAEAIEPIDQALLGRIIEATPDRRETEIIDLMAALPALARSVQTTGTKGLLPGEILTQADARTSITEGETDRVKKVTVGEIDLMAVMVGRAVTTLTIVLETVRTIATAVRAEAILTSVAMIAAATGHLGERADKVGVTPMIEQATDARTIAGRTETLAMTETGVAALGLADVMRIAVTVVQGIMSQEEETTRAVIAPLSPEIVSRATIDISRIATA